MALSWPPSGPSPSSPAPSSAGGTARSSPPTTRAPSCRAAIPLIREGNRANTAVIIIDSGAIRAEYYSATADSIDGNTVFATASLSKWFTAHAVMKLVEQGKLDLDRPVESYLTRWRFPAGATGTRDVTARRLLSHTAGLTDGLGFGDYRREETLPTLEEAPVRTARVRRAPGDAHRHGHRARHRVPILGWRIPAARAARRGTLGRTLRGPSSNAEYVSAARHGAFRLR